MMEYTFEGFVNWLGTQDPDDGYCWGDHLDCPVGRFQQACRDSGTIVIDPKCEYATLFKGLRKRPTAWSLVWELLFKNTPLKTTTPYWDITASDGPRTMGACLKRALKYTYIGTE